MEPPRVRPCLRQRAGAVGELADERGKLLFQLVPRQTLVQRPHRRVLPELVLQVPGQSVVLRPNSLHVTGVKHIRRSTVLPVQELLACRRPARGR